MKKIVVMLLSGLSLNAFASQSKVYCKLDDNKIYDALSEEGFYTCSSAFAGNSEGCFVGKRAEVIEMINSDKFNWGGEMWVANAHFKGANEISYEFVDGPNEFKEKMTLKRCTRCFFVACR